MRIEVIDHERELALLTDATAWERLGRELRGCDPRSYVALLKIADEICAIHRDPLRGTTTGIASYLLRKSSAQFD